MHATRQEAIPSAPVRRVRTLWLLAATALMQVGCASFAPIRGIPASRIPQGLVGDSRNDLERMDFLRLRQDPPDIHLIGSRDVLGIYVAGIVGKADEAPPVHMPKEGSNLPPAIGYPFVVRDNGTLSLPLIQPIKVEGLTIEEVEVAIKRAYTEGPNPVLKQKEGDETTSARIIVSLIRERTYQVMVVREDSAVSPQSTQSQGSGGAGGNGRSAGQFLQHGAGFVLDLPIYQNDVMHALTQTGGLPGLDAKDEVYILRGGFRDAAEAERLRANMNKSGDPCGYCRNHFRSRFQNTRHMLRIPLRYDPAKGVPEFDQEAIILRDGDIIVVESRSRDVFYTGGLLQGGEYLLPRDYDLDVLGAISIAGGQIGGGFGTGHGGPFGGGLGGLIPPSEVLVVRTVPGCGTITIKTNMTRALVSREDRILIQPGDIVMLRYTTGELIANIALSTVNFNFLFNGFNRF